MVGDRDPATRTEGEGLTLDMPEGLGAFAPGQEQGERYQILEMLGRGGMGEVWRAFDLKLRVEVALKALREDLFKSEHRLELLRREVRAAREVMSPNVCRIFDLVEVDGRELVSMEYVDGATLLEVLQERGPLDLVEAQDIASQFLAGLEAIHQAGLVHRDIKPENIMLTRAGRVVVMDFGLARQEAEGGGSVSGTPAYMSPEQAEGLMLDARADVYSAGVVLAEMVSPEGISSFESRQSVWEGVRSDPARVPDSPWAPVLKRAVAKDRERRYHTAHTLTRALEDVTLRVEGAEDLHPYPGLASFTEEDAEYFFGREAEVEQMWRKLDRPHLLALVGPSGAGKTSFLRAGLIPSAGPGWGILRCTPGSTPFLSVGQSLADEMASDTEVLEMMARGGHEPDTLVDASARWRRHHDHALLIVDQFEELFTHSSSEEQSRFTELMRRLAIEADVFVLLSMRDDFLLRCREHEALAPVFTDLTALLPPTGGALRRAVVQPATKCGYRFENDELVQEVLAEVEGERGALPLLAFALARLWENRDREAGLLTREAYHDIGGVGGALARHAETTIDRIGSDRIAIVRELFRNLVTAEGTRAVREWSELLSVFDGADISRAGMKPAPTKDLSAARKTAVAAGFIPARESAEEVLGELIDARLLTSYEVREGDEGPTRRVEIIHESLLANWPRLVRWRTQDQEGAQLRDELRQAARTWDEHGRHDDLLWTGTAYREYQLWRERYAGGLTEVEEGFASAMTSLATRRRRRRRLAATAAFTILLVVLAVVGALWRRSVEETRRAEAGKLLALGRTVIEGDTTAALAYARASLELADTPEARRFAVEVLWRGPVARILPVRRMERELGLADDPTPLGIIEHSPDGRWLAVLKRSNRQVVLFPRDGGPARAVPRQPDGNVRILEFGPHGDLLITGGSGESLRFWSLPELEEIRSAALDGMWSRGVVRGGRLLTFTQLHREGRDLLARAWPLPGGEPEVLGNFSRPFAGADFDPSGTKIAHGRAREVVVSPLKPPDLSQGRIVGEVGERVQDVAFAPGGDRLAALDRSGEILVWSTEEGDAGPSHAFRGRRYEFFETRFDPSGRFLTQLGPGNAHLLWDLDGPPDSEPTVFARSVIAEWNSLDFNPTGEWLATSYGIDTVELWTLNAPRARIFSEVSSSTFSIAFTSDARWLATCSLNQPARLWPLNAVDGSPRDLIPEEPCMALATHPTRDEILVGTTRGEVVVFSTEAGSTRRFLGGFGGEANAAPVGFDPQGLRAFASPYNAGRAFKDPKERVLRIWDLESGQEQVYSIAHLTDSDWDGAFFIGLAEDGSLYAPLQGGVARLTLPSKPGGTISSEAIVDVYSPTSTLSPDGESLLVQGDESTGKHAFESELLLVFDLAHGGSRRITTHGNRLSPGARVDPSGRIIVTGDVEGVVRAGPITGEEPHLLLGHEGMVLGLAISPDGKWIASVTEESIRLWPMPDVSKPPLHTLPHDKLLAKLDTLTNLRAVPDQESSTGWKLKVGSFPGWAEVPEW